MGDTSHRLAGGVFATETSTLCAPGKERDDPGGNKQVMEKQVDTLLTYTGQRSGDGSGETLVGLVALPSQYNLFVQDTTHTKPYRESGWGLQ